MNTKKDKSLPEKYSAAAFPAAPVPVSTGIVTQETVPVSSQYFRKKTAKTNGKRDPNIVNDSLFTIRRGDTYYVISENYAYKTETYYSILHHELAGDPVRPSTSAILDAYVVPVCLERAKLAGIPVCAWGISQVYVPLPAILYGLNYFATTADYFIVYNADQAKEAIKHITNKGKYPFCYQKLDESATIHTCVGIFGQTTSPCTPIALLAGQVYEHFSIPLVKMIFVKKGDNYLLSSLSPTKYSQLSAEERTLLGAYLTHQEFL
jgi:hypothetical protein